MGDGVQMAEVPVDGIVLHDGDPGCGTQDELRASSCLRVVGGVHAGVRGWRLIGLTSVDSVDSRNLLTSGPVGDVAGGGGRGGRQISPG